MTDTTVTPEMLLFLAGKMGLPNPVLHAYPNHVTCADDQVAINEPRPNGYSFNPATDDAQFGRLVVWAAMQGMEPDFSHGIVRVWPIGKDYPCAEENDSTPDSIRAAAVVAICRALGWEAANVPE